MHSPHSVLSDNNVASYQSARWWTKWLKISFWISFNAAAKLPPHPCAENAVVHRALSILGHSVCFFANGPDKWAQSSCARTALTFSRSDREKRRLQRRLGRRTREKHWRFQLDCQCFSMAHFRRDCFLMGLSNKVIKPKARLIPEFRLHC